MPRWNWITATEVLKNINFIETAVPRRLFFGLTVANIPGNIIFSGYFQEIIMPYADLGQYKFHYLEYGVENRVRGTILLLHAFTLDHRMWIEDAGYFAREYHVLVPDFKGHGKSEAPKSGYSRADRVEDMIRFLDVLKIDKVHLVGLSYGGTTGIGIALKYPGRLKSLTLVGTSAAGFDPGPKISRIDKIAKEKGVDKAKDKWITSSLGWYTEKQQGIKKLVETMMLEHSGVVWADPMRGKYPREYDLEKVDSIKLPVNIIVGSEDRIFLQLAEQLHGLIDNSELHVMDNTGHLANLEAPDRFRDIVAKFISVIV